MKCIQMCHFFSFLSRKIVIFLSRSSLAHLSVGRVVNFGCRGKEERSMPTGSRHKRRIIMAEGVALMRIKDCNMVLIIFTNNCVCYIMYKNSRLK